MKTTLVQTLLNDHCFINFAALFTILLFRNGLYCVMLEVKFKCNFTTIDILEKNAFDQITNIKKKAFKKCW